MTLTIVIVFLIGYLFISLEGNLKVNKTAIALLLSVVLWTLYTCGLSGYTPEGVAFEDFKNAVINSRFVEHVGDTSEILFFLLGAMTIVEVVDSNGGFNFVRQKLATRSKHALLWRVIIVTFFLSATLDNLTTSIVMVMVLRKLVVSRHTRMLYCGVVILAANAGGAFSPIGDVTTIMLWIKGNVSSMGVISELFLPSLATVIVPAVVLQWQMKGRLRPMVKEPEGTEEKYDFSLTQRNVVFYVGIVGLLSVPVFRSVTGLPPFMGVILVLSILWVITEFFYSSRKIESNRANRVSRVLHSIDMSTILFFLGILMSVAALEETGVLTTFGKTLDQLTEGNHYLVTGVIGVASSIVDNVPLVASCMGMYDIQMVGDFAQDGIFWQLLAYCAGTGGSILIIGSAAGVVVMGFEKISFGWYMRHFSLLALLGMLSGMGTYYLQRVLFF
ncbi:MAG: sodium:proton antiporter NhaD [Bacteroidaceae bacterium]|nr:sodium:proton antiporter NhaD [Bacteroidaceae bacterium]